MRPAPADPGKNISIVMANPDGARGAPAPPGADAEQDQRVLRNALGRYATGVAIVMTRTDQAALVGMTINSFSSASLTPPLVLWSMQSDANSAPSFRAAKGFTISVLKSTHEDIARLCARKDGVAALGDYLIDAPSGLPRLMDACAWFDCRTVARHLAGDHEILVGHIGDFGDAPGSTLLFHDSHFKSTAD